MNGKGTKGKLKRNSHKEAQKEFNVLLDFWSRRISRKERVIYRFDDENLYIFAIGGHYDSLP